jgi:hypothetical protein
VSAIKPVIPGARNVGVAAEPHMVSWMCAEHRPAERLACETDAISALSGPHMPRVPIATHKRCHQVARKPTVLADHPMLSENNFAGLL